MGAAMGRRMGCGRGFRCLPGSRSHGSQPRPGGPIWSVGVARNLYFGVQPLAWYLHTLRGAQPWLVVVC
eukprot:9337818-Pyramimonas_sp.AAC.1